MALNVEMMEKLHDFGGLMVYRASYFDPLSWTVKHEPSTFNEDVAIAAVKRHQDRGVPASYTSELVKFDGMFSA